MYLLILLFFHKGHTVYINAYQRFSTKKSNMHQMSYFTQAEHLPITSKVDQIKNSLRFKSPQLSEKHAVKFLKQARPL